MGLGGLVRYTLLEFVLISRDSPGAGWWGISYLYIIGVWHQLVQISRDSPGAGWIT